MTTRLKCWPANWDAIVSGEKTAEIRSTEDRTFAVGDILELERWDPETSQRSVVADRPMVVAAKVTHVEHMAGDVNLMGVRLTQGEKPGALVRLAVLSIYVMGPVFE